MRKAPREPSRLLGLALLVLAGACGGGAREAVLGPASPAHGTLEVQELVYDAGKVDRGATVSHSFLLRNVGTGNLSVNAEPG
jgi:hypothetical protein